MNNNHNHFIRNFFKKAFNLAKDFLHGVGNSIGNVASRILLGKKGYSEAYQTVLKNEMAKELKNNIENNTHPEKEQGQKEPKQKEQGQKEPKQREQGQKKPKQREQEQKEQNKTKQKNETEKNKEQQQEADPIKEELPDDNNKRTEELAGLDHYLDDDLGFMSPDEVVTTDINDFPEENADNNIKQKIEEPKEKSLEERLKEHLEKEGAVEMQKDDLHITISKPDKQEYGDGYICTIEDTSISKKSPDRIKETYEPTLEDIAAKVSGYDDIKQLSNKITETMITGKNHEELSIGKIQISLNRTNENSYEAVLGGNKIEINNDEQAEDLAKEAYKQSQEMENILSKLSYNARNDISTRIAAENLDISISSNNGEYQMTDNLSDCAPVSFDSVESLENRVADILQDHPAYMAEISTEEMKEVEKIQIDNKDFSPTEKEYEESLPDDNNELDKKPEELTGLDHYLDDDLRAFSDQYEEQTRIKDADKLIDEAVNYCPDCMDGVEPEYQEMEI